MGHSCRKRTSSQVDQTCMDNMNCCGSTPLTMKGVVSEETDAALVGVVHKKFNLVLSS